VRARLGGLPGVEGVTAVGGFPLDGLSGNVGWGTPDAAFDQSRFQQADVHAVLPGYFEVMQAKVLAGRTFTSSDNTPNSRDVIIDDLLARKAFPGLRPQAVLGRRLLVRLRGDTSQDFNVIGIVRHEQNSPVAVDTREALFVADAQFGYMRTERWVLRTQRDYASLAPAIRAAVREIDPLLPVTEVQPAQAFIDRASAATRFALMLIGAFAGIAAILASVGLYGVLASVVRQRTAEIGVRLAFGATSSNVFALIIGRGMALSALGIGAGFGISLLVTRAMRALIVGVTPNDPTTYCVVALLFFTVAFAACYIPARRAASLDPNVALRST
jgi:putative ABC transport system permease protein